MFRYQTTDQQFRFDFMLLLRSLFDHALLRVQTTGKVPQLDQHGGSEEEINDICEYLLLSVAMNCLSIIAYEDSTPRDVLSGSSDVEGLATAWVSVISYGVSMHLSSPNSFAYSR